MIVPVMAISNLVLTQQIYSEETNRAHAHYREPVPLIKWEISLVYWNRSFVQFREFKIERRGRQLERQKNNRFN